jgi:hypothetical protein
MNSHINIARLKIVATILSDFREEIVFVGGATVSLYAATKIIELLKELK